MPYVKLDIWQFVLLLEEVIDMNILFNHVYDFLLIFHTCMWFGGIFLLENTRDD